MELSSDSEILEKQIFFYSTSVHSILMQNWWSQKTKNKKKTKKKEKRKKEKKKKQNLSISKQNQNLTIPGEALTL